MGYKMKTHLEITKELNSISDIVETLFYNDEPFKSLLLKKGEVLQEICNLREKLKSLNEQIDFFQQYQERNFPQIIN